jgi:hypothetical protein
VYGYLFLEAKVRLDSAFTGLMNHGLNLRFE